MTKAEGIWACRVISANSGANDKGLIEIVINVQITDPEAPDGTIGARCSYEETIDGKSAKYAARAMKAVGWQGKTALSLKADVAAWIASGDGISTVEIKHLMRTKGKKAGTIWDKANSIGYAGKVLKPASGEFLDDADEQLRRAMMEDDDKGGPPPRDSGPYHGDPVDDIPFASCDIGREPSSIAAMFRRSV